MLTKELTESGAMLLNFNTIKGQVIAKTKATANRRLTFWLEVKGRTTVQLTQRNIDGIDYYNGIVN